MKTSVNNQKVREKLEKKFNPGDFKINLSEKVIGPVDVESLHTLKENLNLSNEEKNSVLLPFNRRPYFLAEIIKMTGNVENHNPLILAIPTNWDGIEGHVNIPIHRGLQEKIIERYIKLIRKHHYHHL